LLFAQQNAIRRETGKWIVVKENRLLQKENLNFMKHQQKLIPE